MKRKISGMLLAAASIFASAQTGAAQAKYVFYFIGDGMGMGHVATTETYRRDVLKTDAPLLMLTFPVASQLRTHSASSPVTDSAAAGTALSTGSKTNNYMVGTASDSTNLYSVAARFMQTGRAVGIVTSVAGDDATPAAFYAHAVSRNDKSEISAYAPQSGVTFFGAPKFKGMTDREGNSTDWVERMCAAGYLPVHTYDQYLLSRQPDAKYLMLAENPCGEQLGYTLDAAEGMLTLAEMTETAVDALADDPDGFFLMVEGGNIDWAAHANDGAAVVREILAFQDAIDVAVRFSQKYPDETLIVVTADHDTGGMALGRRDNERNIRLELIDLQKISKDRFSDWCRDSFRDKVPDWEQMRAFLQENLSLWQGIPLTESETQKIRESFDETFVTRRAKDEKSLYNEFNRFTVTLFDIINRHYGIGFTSGNHTGNFVPLYARGVDAMLFTRAMDNTEVPMLLLKAAGITPQAEATPQK